MISRVAILLCVAACSGDTEWRTFYGIEYQTPRASESSIVDSVLPGPNGEGGSPVGERPVVTVVANGPHGFYIQITKSSYAMTLEGEKATYLGNKIGANLVGKTTPGGWELVGDQTTEGGGPPIHFQEIYVDLGGGHYLCGYAEQNCHDLAVAEAVCRSMRAKP